MKKMKKLLTGLLALVMAITTVAIQTPITAKAASTVDMTETGSLTLYKYYYENTTIPSNNPSGTGEELTTDELNGIVKDNEGNVIAQPLKGAGFTVWKIADLDGKVTITGKTDQTYTVTGTLANDVAAAEALIKKDDGTYIAATYTETKTGEDGKVTFGTISSTDFGYYYVKETYTPDNVSSAPVSFVVSIPMTSQGTNAGAEWIYDVVVYPKNETTSAGVTIKKVDANNTDTTIAEAKFVLQRNEGTTDGPDWKYVGATETSGSYTYSYGEANYSDAYQFKAGVPIQGLAEGKYRLFEVEVEDGYIMDGTIAYDFTVAKNGEITSSKTDIISYAVKDGENDNTSATLTIKNERPDVEKSVKDNADSTSDTDAWVNETDYSVDDTIEYKIKVSVPDNIAKLSTFKITDTPTGIEDNIESIKIYIDATCQTSAELTVDTDYTVIESGDGFVIDFISSSTNKVTDAMATYKGTDLYIKYEATLKENAFSITTAGNPNTVKLDYTNAIYPDSSATDQPNAGEAEDKAYIEDSAIVYTFQVHVNKVDGSGDALTGAKFALYKCETGGEKTEATIIADGVNIKEAEVDSDGYFEVSGLENGYYYLIETQAPTGYNLLTVPVQVPLQITYTTKFTESTEWAWEQDTEGNWNLIKHEITSSETTFTTSETIEDTDITDGSYDFNVENNKGFTLPTTGGVGTYIFVFVGVSMMAAAVILFFTTKKKEVK